MRSKLGWLENNSSQSLGFSSGGAKGPKVGRPQPPALWMLGSRPASSYGVPRGGACFFWEKDSVRNCSACSPALADNEPKREGDI